jgi:hypothetical protein
MRETNKEYGAGRVSGNEMKKNSGWERKCWQLSHKVVMEECTGKVTGEQGLLVGGWWRSEALCTGGKVI